MMLIILIFSRFFHCNIIWVLYPFTSFLIISPFMGSCKCRRGLSDPWSAFFYCSCCVSVFLGLMCFLNKLMRMMMMMMMTSFAH